MSPFANLLGDLRNRRGMRQKDLADLLGYEQSYISAMEVGTKGTPTIEFISKMSQRLNLDEAEKKELELAIARSDRKVVLPVNASQKLYELCYELRLAVDQLLPSQIEMMLRILRLPQDLKLDNNRALAADAIISKRRI